MGQRCQINTIILMSPLVSFYKEPYRDTAFWIGQLSTERREL